jgi:phage antirepressor YoqD-like protein
MRNILLLITIGLSSCQSAPKTEVKVEGKQYEWEVKEGNVQKDTASPKLQFADSDLETFGVTRIGQSAN